MLEKGFPEKFLHIFVTVTPLVNTLVEINVKLKKGD